MAGKRVAVIVGAGPAGLTAALELLRRTDVRPVVLEESGDVGGLSRTVVHAGNRMDIGGHRFFSKSDWVMGWWRDILPVALDGEQPAGRERVMLVRRRLSRIYYLGRFFDYPVKLDAATLRNLGPLRVVRIGFSYLRAALFPRRPVRSLEDFIVNRFGYELYATFFRDYTEKVWGVPCRKISPEWGAQRIKGLSITRAILHALRKGFVRQSLEAQKKGQTSLIERFLYPKYGPGQMWQEVAARVEEGGGEVLFDRRVVGLRLAAGRVAAVVAVDAAGNRHEYAADFVFSTMPVRDLAAAIEPPPPPEVRRVADGLPYRDFITVGLLVGGMRPHAQARSTQPSHMPPDNWIYIQESGVKIGRLQVFNNWSPGLVADPGTVWLGLEYFCSEGDDLWRLDDAAMIRLGTEELARIGLIDPSAVRDGTVVRVPKAYPAYFGTYGEFDSLRRWLDGIPNLFLIGRNGMHKYNNQDHSMLTARLAVEAVAAGSADKAAIWAVNIDDEYHEEKAG